MAHESTESEVRVLTSQDEVREAVVEVAKLAQRSLTILTPDLEPGIYDDEAFLEAVKRLVLARSYSRVRVLISDPRRTVRTGNPFVKMGSRLKTYIEFRNLDKAYRDNFPGAFIIADETAILYRNDGHQPEGIFGRHQPSVARKHLEAFAKPWEASVFRRTRHVEEI